VPLTSLKLLKKVKANKIKIRKSQY